MIIAVFYVTGRLYKRNDFMIIHSTSWHYRNIISGFLSVFEKQQRALYNYKLSKYPYTLSVVYRCEAIKNHD